MKSKISQEEVEKFQALMERNHHMRLTFTEAKVRYLQLLNLFWILAHRAPKEGEPPYDPPPPPWL